MKETAADPEVALAQCEKQMRQALREFANEEAIAHGTDALRHLEELRAGPARDERELRLLLGLAGALVASRGYGDLALRAPLLRALALARKLNDGPPLAATLAFLCGHHMQRGEHGLTRDLAEEFQAVSEHQGDRRSRTSALFLLSTALLWCGQYESSVRRSREAIDLHDPVDFEFMAVGANDTGITARGVHALGLWVLGRPREAVRFAEQGVEMARTRLPAPHYSSLCWALTFRLLLELHRGEFESAQGAASELVAVAEEHRYQRLLAWGTSLGACARIESGDFAEAVPALEASLSAYDDSEAGFWRSYCHGPMAKGYAALGRWDEALELLHRSQAHAAKTGERFYQADLHRIEGDLLLGRDPGDGEVAERSYRRAIKLARQSDGVAWELRALTGLARLQARRAADRDAVGELRALHDRLAGNGSSVDLDRASRVLSASLPA